MVPEQGEERCLVLQRASGFSPGGGTPVSVIVPCFNEVESLPHLARVLQTLPGRHPQYRWQFLFVDDSSTDGTPDVLRDLFGSWPHVGILGHPVNRGLSGALHTGLCQAETEVVCSIDCDCTYDPHALAEMIPLLSAGVDLVTASPYHPKGGVEGVPLWRLFVSRCASLLYRLVFRLPVYTYTCCVRVYRRSAVLPLEVSEAGFSGVTELLLRVALNGGGIAEYPAVLRARQAGQSKMRVVRNTLKHLRLLGRLAAQRTGPAGRVISASAG